MESLFFWNKWQKSPRILYGVSLILFIISLIFYGYSEFAEKNKGLAWEIVPQIKNTEITVDTFTKGFFGFSVNAGGRYIIQYFEGTLLNSPLWCSYLILCSIFIILLSGCVTASYTKGIWYYVSLTFLGAFFYLLNLDVLEVFGFKNTYWTIISFLTFGCTVHYFHSFRPFTPIYWRYAFIGFLSLLFCFITVKFSVQAEPLRHFAAYGWPAVFFASLLFILMVSTDVPAAFLYLVTDSRNAKKSSSLLNFLLITIFFLGNVCLTFMKNRGSIDWNIFYIEAPLLLIISSVLGIWSFRKKEPLYESFADFSPATAIWYAGMAINCFLCYAFANMTANDPLQEVFEDSVIFSQLTMGMMFIVFVVANFMGMMEQNLPAHMVLYKPRFMPFAFVRIIGLIGILSIVLYNNNYQYRQAIAGNLIQKAEVFIAEENFPLAEEYLNSALSYDVGNHKANYLLAMLLRQKSREDIVAKGLLKQSVFKNPSPQAYATLGISFLQEGDIIRSLETLKEGKSKFPDSKEILNNLALAYSKTDIKDSAFYYFSLSRKADNTNLVAAANQLAFAIENNITPDLEAGEVSDDAVFKTNFIALLNKTNKEYKAKPDSSFLSDTTLTPQKAAMVINLSLNNLKARDNFPVKWLDTLISKPGNAGYYEELMFLKACRLYYSGRIADGIVTLDQLQATSKDRIRYTNILSNWLLQQDAPRVAMDFLVKAKEAGDLNADLGMAIATSFYLEGSAALDYWRSPLIANEKTFREIAIALHDPKPNVFKAGILPQSVSDPEILYRTFISLPEDENKRKSAARLMEHFTDIGKPQLALQVYKQTKETEESRWQYKRALKKLNDRESLSGLIAENKPTGKTLFLEAWLKEKSNPAEAAVLYKKALKVSPLYEEGVTDAINFLKSKQTDEENYDMLLTSVMLNQYSPHIQKAYTLQCVQSNYFNFADYSLTKLKDLLPKKEYEAFAAEVEKSKEKRLNEIEWK